MPKFANPDEESINYSTWGLIKDTWGFVKPYRTRFLFASLLRFSSDLAGLYPTYAFATIISLLSQPPLAAQRDTVITQIELLAASIAWQFIATYFWRTTSNTIIPKVQLDVELLSIKHLFGLNISWHEKENTGNRLKRIGNGTSGIATVLRTWINHVIPIAVNFIGTVIIVSRYNTFTGVAIAVYVVVYYTLSYFLTKRAARSARAVNLTAETLNGLEYQATSNIRTVKVMGMQSAITRSLTEQASDVFSKIKKREFHFQDRLTLLALWSQFVRVSTLTLIIFGVIAGRYELGFFVLFNGYFNTVRELASSMSDITQDIIIARYSVYRLKEMLNEPVTIDNDDGKLEFPTHWKEMSLQNVAFGYGENQVLTNVSFTIRRGEKIGIVGLSGAGKSTLFKLLLKEYEDFTGSILFDNTPIQNIKKGDYFKHVAVVLQDTEVFNFSLKENVCIANDAQKNNEHLLQRSLQIAHVTDFLHKLPAGTETLIGEKGVKLSGGERQRLGIARAVFKEPQVLLLDEATSHLDLESEEKIRDSLHTFFEGVTAIVIAHRLTTIKEMDKILVVEGGTLVEQGNFEALYAKKGRFYELWEKQKL